jgi:hypothetical protein
MTKTIEISKEQWMPIWSQAYAYLMSVDLERFEYTNQDTFLISFSKEDDCVEFCITWL